MILNEFEAVPNSANGPIIFTYYDESALSRSPLQYSSRNILFSLLRRELRRNILFSLLRRELGRESLITLSYVPKGLSLVQVLQDENSDHIFRGIASLHHFMSDFAHLFGV